MLVSKIDGSQYKNLTGLSRHCYVNKISLLEYFIKYENFIIPKCKFCDKNSLYRRMNTIPIYYKTCGDIKCKSKMIKLRNPHTEESKEKIRKKRIDYLKKKTGKTAWERRSAGEMSHLEQWFYDNVIIKNNLCDKYDIITEYSEYPYFIDFAFINIKLAIELDGKCHFNNGHTRIEHDIKRDKILNEKGWKVYRIKYDEINNNTINEFINFLNNIENYENKIYGNNLYTYTIIKKEVNITNKLNNINNKLQNNELDIIIDKNNIPSLTNINTIIYENSQKQYIDLILNSNINFSKIGWCLKVSKILKRRPQKVTQWMKRFMNDFYNEKCYKRIKPSSEF